MRNLKPMDAVSWDSGFKVGIIKRVFSDTYEMWYLHFGVLETKILHWKYVLGEEHNRNHDDIEQHLTHLKMDFI